MYVQTIDSLPRMHEQQRSNLQETYSSVSLEAVGQNMITGMQMTNR